MQLLAERVVELNIVSSVSAMTVCSTLKKTNLSLTSAGTGKSRRTKMPHSLAAMEDVLEVYARLYNRRFPVVCMDESSAQLVGEVHEPIPAAPGHPVLMDDECVRKGVASIFIEVEPLGGKRQVKITERRTRIGWACFIEEMLEKRYPKAKKVVLVMDNLNTQSIASLYEAFPPEKARRLADRLEIHHTPKHWS